MCIPQPLFKTVHQLLYLQITAVIRQLHGTHWLVYRHLETTLQALERNWKQRPLTFEVKFVLFEMWWIAFTLKVSAGLTSFSSFTTAQQVVGKFLQRSRLPYAETTGDHDKLLASKSTSTFQRWLTSQLAKYGQFVPCGCITSNMAENS